MTGTGQAQLFAGAVVLAAAAVLFVLMAVRPVVVVVEAAERLDPDLFVVAARERGPEEIKPVPTATSLLSEAGFDSDEITRQLLVMGVPAAAFVLPHDMPLELSNEQKRQRLCLAEAIYHEARNQPVLGRLAVADVVMNRVDDRRFPRSVCSVVFQGQGSQKGCQFSFACDGSLIRAREPEAWDEAQRLADLVYRGFTPPLTEMATFYHADYVSPRWAKVFVETKTIANHRFYRPPGALRIAASRLGVDLENAGG